MATVAELVFVRMALQTGLRETHRVLLAVRRDIFQVTIPHHPIPPLDKKIHVVLPHVLCRFHTLLLSSRRELQLGRALCAPVKPTVPDRQGSNSEKNYDDSGYKTFVIQCSLRSLLRVTGSVFRVESGEIVVELVTRNRPLAARNS
jgi:hypothetical protein